MANLDIRQISKNFGPTPVLRGVDLDVHDGEFISLVGPSGCGKSTLLRIIAGLEAPDTGQILLSDRDVTHVRAADRNLSMVFQSYALYPHLSVAENIAVPLRMRQLSATQRLPLIGPFTPGARAASQTITAMVENAAEMLDIVPLLHRKPGQLSGGQRQRVALGRALVRDPAAFLLDEPLSNLDAKLRVQTRSEIAQLHRKLAATFIYVTHDQVEAMTMSHRIAVMVDGEILQCASPDVIYHDPDDIRVAEFIGSPKINILPADRRGAEVFFAGNKLPLNAVTDVPDALQIGLRPEALILTTQAPVLKGKITHSENLGAEVFAHIAVPGWDGQLVVKAAADQRHQLVLNAQVGLGMTMQDALLFGPDGKRLRRLEAITSHKLEVA